MSEEAAPPPPAVAEASGLPPPAPQAAGHLQPPSPGQLPVHPGAEGDAKAQPEFSASAAEFAPGVAAATAPLTDEVDVVNLLPPSHRALLRGGYEDYTGVWVAYYIGRLKSFNHKNGFGFLECMQCRKDYGRDVFVHKNFVPHPWNIGQPVEFAVMSNQRGQPQAFDVNWLPRLDRPQPRGAPGAGGGLSTGGTGDTAGSGGRGAAAAAAAAQAAVLATPPTEPRKLGTLKSFSAGQGYGFITCEEVFQSHQRDTYFDKGQLPPGSNWTYGQTIEFTLGLNGRNQPQARDINWDPVPRTPTVASASQTSEPHKSTNRTNVVPSSAERLQKLLVLVHEKNYENAIITAIDLQGGSANDESDNVDYVMFVLDRMGTAEESIELVGDVAKMLLLVMLAKMLMTAAPIPVGHEAVARARCQHMVKWFGKLAACLNPTSTMQVQENLPSVLQQISQHLRQALHDNPLVTEEEQATAIHGAFLALQGKVKELPSGFSV